MDWNNDGKKDLLTGEYTGTIRIYMNVGSDASPSLNWYGYLQVGGATFDCGYRSMIDIVDWNNDGKKDLLCGESSGRVFLLLNTGSDAGPVFASSTLVQDSGATLDVGTMSHPVACDWDDDGKKDLLVGDANGNIRFYENQGSDAGPVFNGYVLLKAGSGAPDLDVGQNARPEVADWDNDGIQDLVVGAINGTVTCFPASWPVLVTAPGSVTEGDGVLTGQGSVSRHDPVGSDTVVYLGCDDTSEIGIPASVTIAAGSTSAPFDITVIDDSELDGSHDVSITAVVAGETNDQSTITVHDNESAELTVCLRTSATEGDGVLVNAGIVAASSPPDTDVIIELTSDNTNELVVPATVSLLAGETNVSFDVTVVDDTQIDGDQSVTLAAHVENWTDGSADMTILDDENTDLVLYLPALAGELDGVLFDAGFVMISGTLPAALTVSLASDDFTELIVPATVVIPAGATWAMFNLIVLDDDDYDGIQSVTVTAAATGFNGDDCSIQIADSEVDHLVISAVASPQIAAVPFAVAVGACDINGANSSYTGTVTISANGDSGALAIYPATSRSFVNGQWTGYLAVNALDTNVRLTADDAVGHTVTGGVFDVVPGPLHHFEWATLPEQQVAGEPFDVQISARDAAGYLVTGFAGTVMFGASDDVPGTNILVGGGSGTWEYPLATYYHDARTQAIYPPAEIGHVGAILGLALDVTREPGQTLNGWTIRMKHTPIQDYMLSSAWESNGWTSVYSATTTISTTGTVTFGFSDAFIYNGMQNLMVDFSFDNTSYTTDGYCRYTTTATARSLYYRTDSYYGDPAAWHGPGDGDSPTPSTIHRVPNIRLVVGTPVTVLPAVSGSFLNGTWSGQLLIPDTASNVVLSAHDAGGRLGAGGPVTVTATDDLDDDGMSDRWETEHFGSITNSAGDLSEDRDGDGSCDLFEYMAGTDPTNARSCLAVSNATVAAGDEIVVTWYSQVGKVYDLVRTPSLIGLWTNIETGIPATPPLNVYTDGVPVGSSLFYRIHLNDD